MSMMTIILTVLFYNKSPKDHKPKTKSKVTTSKSSKAALVSEENTVPN